MNTNKKAVELTIKTLIVAIVMIIVVIVVGASVLKYGGYFNAKGKFSDVLIEKDYASCSIGDKLNCNAFYFFEETEDGLIYQTRFVNSTDKVLVLIDSQLNVLEVYRPLKERKDIALAQVEKDKISARIKLYIRDKVDEQDKEYYVKFAEKYWPEKFYLTEKLDYPEIKVEK